MPDELCQWADMMVIAPLSANSLAKLVNGIADNLLVRLLSVSLFTVTI